MRRAPWKVTRRLAMAQGAEGAQIGWHPGVLLGGDVVLNVGVDPVAILT